MRAAEVPSRSPGPTAEGKIVRLSLCAVLWSLSLTLLPVTGDAVERTEIFSYEQAVPARISKVHARFLSAANLSDAGSPGAFSGFEALPTLEQAEAVNQAINRVPYASDWQLWRQGDYWAEPVEFFARGGDCEVYAVAKYSALRALGVEARLLRVVVVFDELRGLVHAGLILGFGGRVYFLDNLTDELRPWPEIEGYRPIYSLNENGLWLHVDSTTELDRLLNLAGASSGTMGTMSR